MNYDNEVDSAQQGAMRLRRILMIGVGVAVGFAASGYWYLTDRGVQLAAASAATNQDRARATSAVGASPAMALLRANLENTSADAGPQVLVLSALTPDEARRWNASFPLDQGPNPPAKAFYLRAAAEDAERATDCLTAAVYYEAAGEGAEGQRAVAQVVLNRVRHAAFPKTVCGVVLQGAQRATGCQFSFTCDGSLSRAPSARGWAEARKIAVAALNGHVEKSVGNATHYHADYVAPYWSPTLLKVAVVKTHIFYRWTGETGLPQAFFGQYLGTEPAGLFPASLIQGTEEPAAGAEQEVVLVEEPDLAEPLASNPEEALAPLPVEDVVAIESAENLLRADQMDWLGRPKEQVRPRIARAEVGMF